MRNKAVVIFVLGQAQNLMLPGLLAKHKGEDVFVFSVYPVLFSFDGRLFNIKPSSFLEGGKLFLDLIFVFFRLRFVDEIVLYSPHLLNFLANKTYFSFLGKIRLYYLFDGILNYRQVSANSGVIKRYQDRQFYKSLLVFHKYVRSFGDVVNQGLDNVVGMVVPDGVVEDNLNFQLPVFKVNVAVEAYNPKNRVLVLPPPLKGKKLGVFQEKLRRFLLAEHSDKLILVKPHPSQAENGFDILNLEQDGLSVEMVFDVRPAETVFVERECCAVVSSTSSALIMIKSLYPDANAYSILDGWEIHDEELRRVVEVMIGSGVVVI